MPRTRICLVLLGAILVAFSVGQALSQQAPPATPDQLAEIQTFNEDFSTTRMQDSEGAWVILRTPTSLDDERSQRAILGTPPGVLGNFKTLYDADTRAVSYERVIRDFVLGGHTASNSTLAYLQDKLAAGTLAADDVAFLTSLIKLATHGMNKGFIPGGDFHSNLVNRIKDVARKVNSPSFSNVVNSLSALSAVSKFLDKSIVASLVLGSLANDQAEAKLAKLQTALLQTRPGSPIDPALKSALDASQRNISEARTAFGRLGVVLHDNQRELIASGIQFGVAILNLTKTLPAKVSPWLAAPLLEYRVLNAMSRRWEAVQDASLLATLSDVVQTSSALSPQEKLLFVRQSRARSYALLAHTFDSRLGHFKDFIDALRGRGKTNQELAQYYKQREDLNARLASAQQPTLAVPPPSPAPTTDIVSAIPQAPPAPPPDPTSALRSRLRDAGRLQAELDYLQHQHHGAVVSADTAAAQTILDQMRALEERARSIQQGMRDAVARMEATSRAQRAGQKSNSTAKSGLQTAIGFTQGKVADAIALHQRRQAALAYLTKDQQARLTPGELARRAEQAAQDSARSGDRSRANDFQRLSAAAKGTASRAAHYASPSRVSGGYARTTSASAKSVVSRYGSVPGGVILEAAGDGVGRVQNADYDRQLHALVFDGKLTYLIPIEPPDAAAILEAIHSDDRMGVSLGGVDIIYGSLPSRSKVALDLKIVDLFLADIVLASNHWTRDYKFANAYQPKRNKTDGWSGTVFFNFKDFKFSASDGLLGLAHSGFEVTLVPLSKEDSTEAGHQPDFSAIEAGKVSTEYEDNAKHLGDNIAYYKREKIVYQTFLYGEFAALARALKSAGIALLPLASTIYSLAPPATAARPPPPFAVISAPPSAEPVVERLRGKAFVWAGQNSRSSESFEQCEGRCKEEESCLAFTYFKHIKQCRLMEAPTELLDDTRADSGLKKGGT